MNKITFVAHPEWLREENRKVYHDFGAVLRICFLQVQHLHPNWDMKILHSDKNTLSVDVPPRYDLDFLEQMYASATELVHQDAADWLRLSEFSMLKAVPQFADPSVAEPGNTKADVDTDKTAYLEKLRHLPVMQEYPVLADCLCTQTETIWMLKKMGLTHCAWDQNLLVAMDDDADFEEFARALYKLYRREGLIKSGTNVTTFTTVTSWNLAVSVAEQFVQSQDKPDRADAILVVDVRRAGYEIHIKEMQHALQSISRLDKKFLCIFRTQVLEMDLIERMIDTINDMMPVRAVVAPPAGTDVLKDCFKMLLLETGCTLAQDCDPLIEQWIVQESKDGFGGQELAKRMVRELIQRKVQSNIKSANADKHITTDDIRACLPCTAARIADARGQLDALIGVAEIKQRVLEIAAQIKVHKELAVEGVEKPSIHMMFTGNPGTGKTAVARVIASILREEGVLSKGLLYEVNARELCGQHIGETAPKVTAKCKNAYGSVLFVDEAYALYRDDSPRDFGQEAITTLITEMENHRDDFCVILAGYPDEMEQLMGANPGLRSRIPYTINFPNFTREELNTIFLQMLEGHFAYDESLKQAAEEFFLSIPDEVMTARDFSNARMVRNLYERVWGKAAYRKVLNKESELVLRAEDLSAAVAEQDFKRLIETKSKKRPIGFGQ